MERREEKTFLRFISYWSSYVEMTISIPMIKSFHFELSVLKEKEETRSENEIC